MKPGVKRNGSSSAAGFAFKRVVERVWTRLRDRGSQPEAVYVSRGGAALLAGAEVATRFGVEGDLEVEAVEEPSTLAGQHLLETSYVGIEPWIVVLRQTDQRRRYIVVIEPHGAISGAVETVISELDELRLVPTTETAWANPPRIRRS